MAPIQKVIIFGAGPAGLTTAIRIHQTTNIKCEIYEIRSAPATIGGAIGLMPNGLRLFSRLGVYEELAKRGNSSDRVSIHSLNGGTLGEQDDAYKHPHSVTGFGNMRIKRKDLVEVLVNRAKADGIPIHWGYKVTAIRENDGTASTGGWPVTVTFADGQTDSADLVLGCDGIHSQVRHLYVDPEQEPEYSGAAGLYSIMPAAALPDEVMPQISGLNVMLTGTGMIAAMPCSASGDELYYGFSRHLDAPDTSSVAERDGWETRRNDEVKNFKDSVLEALEKGQGGYVEALRQVAERTTSVAFYPVYRLPEGRAWTRGRCVLVGDAAHAMPPSSGQGTSMAAEDAFLLARLLKHLEDAPPKSLDAATYIHDAYERIRRPRVDDVHGQSTQNAKSRYDPGPLGLWLKEWAIRLAFWMPSSTLGSIGLKEKHMEYDIDEEQI